MAKIPASRKVLEAIQAAGLEAGLSVHVDRTEAVPFDVEELPAIALRISSVSFSYLSQDTATSLHQAVIHVDLHSGETAVEALDAINQMNAALLIEALSADRSLGGLLTSLEEQSLSASEDAGADMGVAVLVLSAMWFSPRGDLFTIIGQDGTLF